MRVLLSILALASASTTNAAGQCTFTPNCDYGKGSRQYGAATTRDECCTLCSNRPGCAAGVWDGNRCWYKTVAQVKGGCQHSAKVKGSCIPKSVKPGPPPAPPPPPIPPLSCSINGTGGTGPVVAFVGDSITYGTGCSEWKYGFVKAINDSVGSKYDLRDCGVSGLDAVKPSHGEHGHGSYWSSAQHTESLAMKPEVVVVMLGTNDADEWCYAQNSSACPGGTSKHYASDLQNVSRKHWLFSMDCHCALPVFYGSYAGSHRCVLFGCFLERQLTQGYMQLPSVKKTYLMIPPPYQYMIGGWSPMTKCPANPLSEGCGLSAPCVFNCQLSRPTRDHLASRPCCAANRFNGARGQGEPEKERAKACIINCVLPTIVRQVAQELHLPAPVDMLSFFNFPGTVNQTLIPVLHPSCEGYKAMGQHLAKQLFSDAA